jgi:hypothetical protein
MDGCIPINELADFIVLFEHPLEEMDVVNQGLVMALSEHEVV